MNENCPPGWEMRHKQAIDQTQQLVVEGVGVDEESPLDHAYSARVRLDTIINRLETGEDENYTRGSLVFDLEQVALIVLSCREAVTETYQAPHTNTHRADAGRAFRRMTREQQDEFKAWCEQNTKPE